MRRRSQVSRGEKPGPGKQLVPMACVGQGSASDKVLPHCVLSPLGLRHSCRTEILIPTVQMRLLSPRDAKLTRPKVL